MDAPDFDLDVTLDSGQTFQWTRDSEGHRVGWIGNRLFSLSQSGGRIRFKSTDGLGRGELGDYLQTGFDTASIRKFFLQRDPFLARAVRFAPGLRVLRQDPWECLAGFILSSTKKVSHIMRIWAEVARRHGESLEWRGVRHHRFPRPEKIAALDEARLRACKMGFRAGYLLAAAQAVSSAKISLDLPFHMTVAEGRAYLMRLAGVGPKIADCVLLFAYGKHGAFPRDVWIDRVLRTIYFRGKTCPKGEMEAFVAEYFGSYAGYAQQFLFHYVRLNPLVLKRRATSDRRPAHVH